MAHKRRAFMRQASELIYRLRVRHKRWMSGQTMLFAIQTSCKLSPHSSTASTKRAKPYRPRRP